ncbi:MAG: YtxH domain-containing protein [Dehalococcoidia bacterium]|nr:YtxH domain-containing protein [Dehalococcoidia bacterium]
MNKNFKRNTALILGGLAVGVAAGMLLAPKSGRKTRANIRHGARAGFDRSAAFWRKMRGRHEQPAEFVLDDEGILSGR